MTETKREMTDSKMASPDTKAQTRAKLAEIARRVRDLRATMPSDSPFAASAFKLHALIGRIEAEVAIDTPPSSLVAAINAWQNAGNVHPLTCGNDSRHPNLVPFDKLGDGVWLRCLACDYLQRVSGTPLASIVAKDVREDSSDV